MMKSKRKNGFLSYALEDRSWADKLHSQLSSLGIDIWYDQRDFRSDQSVDDQVLNAIKESYFIILLLSKKSVSKQGYVRKEVKLALDMVRRLKPVHIFIIPTRIEDCHPKSDEIVGMPSYIDLFVDWMEGINRIDHLIPMEGDLTDLKGVSPLETQARIVDKDNLGGIVRKLQGRHEISIFLENALVRLNTADASVLSRKILNLRNNVKDFAACIELHFLHECGRTDPKTKCNECGAIGSIVHGTIEMGGYSQSDYNDNYIVWCQECFSADYDFEIDYHGTGPLKFDYKKNIYM